MARRTIKCPKCGSENVIITEAKIRNITCLNCGWHATKAEITAIAQDPVLSTLGAVLSAGLIILAVMGIFKIIEDILGGEEQSNVSAHSAYREHRILKT